MISVSVDANSARELRATRTIGPGDTEQEQDIDQPCAPLTINED